MLVNDRNTTPMVISLRIMFTNVEIDGQRIIEINIDNMVRNINGTDVQSDVRSAQGGLVFAI